MSEEDIQNKESSENQEIIKKKEKMEESKKEKLNEEHSEEEKPANGIENVDSDSSKPDKNEDDEKDSSFEESKKDDSDPVDEGRNKKEKKSKKADSKKNEPEPMDESTENLKLEDSVDSKNDTHEESMDNSKDESLENSKEEEDDESEEPPKKGLLERPVEMKGKRERKKVDRFVQEAKKEEVEVEGRGTALKDIPYILNMISKTAPENLKTLHRLAYGRPGSASEVKRNLQKFKGFPFIKDDKAFEKKKMIAEKIVLPELKKIMFVLGLEKSGVKIDLVNRAMEFLLNPHDTGKSIPQTKRKRSSKGSAKSKTSGQRKKKSKDEKETAEDSEGDESEEEKSEGGEEEEEEEEEDEGNADEEEEEEQEVADDDDEESEEEAIKVKKTGKRASKATPKRAPAKKTPKSKTPKTPKSQSKKRAKESDSDESDNSNDQPIKKTKKAPTDGEIKTFIKRLLDKADLEEVTMKKLCQQVFDNYPGQDLSHKKEFIKSTVKSILS